MSHLNIHRHLYKLYAESFFSSHRPPKTEETAAEEERQFLGLDASSLRPYFIAIIVAGGVVVALDYAMHQVKFKPTNSKKLS